MLLLTVVDQKDLGYRLGAADYLMKPFEHERPDRPPCTGSHRAANGCWWSMTIRTWRIWCVSRLDEPYQIEAAAEGLAALDAIAAQRPDVILLDPLLRGDGFELIASLQKDPERRDIPVIVLTAKTLSRQERRLLKEHALAVIQKAQAQPRCIDGGAESGVA